MPFSIHKKKLFRGDFSSFSSLTVVTLLSALAFSLSDSLWAVYLEGFFDNMVFIGLFTGAMAFLSFVSFFFLIPLVERVDKVKLFSSSLLVLAVSYLIFFLTSNLWVLVLVNIVWIIAFNIKITSFGILLKDTTSRKDLSKRVGIMYAVTNAMWIIGPLIAGFISEDRGLRAVFFIASLILFLVWVYVIRLGITDDNVKKRLDVGVIKNFIDFFRDKHRRRAYLIGSSINFWYALIYVFMPLRMLDLGFGLSSIGIFLFMVVIPPTLMDYPAGKLVGRMGYKKVFRIGFMIMFFSAVACFFVSNPLIIMSLLIVAGFGLGMTEGTTESYFLDLVNAREELRFYGPYNTAIDAGSFIGKIVPSLFLLFLPLKFIFLVFAGGMFMSLIISGMIKDKFESRMKD